MNTRMCAYLRGRDVGETTSVLYIFIQVCHHANDSRHCITSSADINDRYRVAIDSTPDTLTIGIHNSTFTLCDNTPSTNGCMPGSCSFVLLLIALDYRGSLKPMIILLRVHHHRYLVVYCKLHDGVDQRVRQYTLAIVREHNAVILSELLLKFTPPRVCFERQPLDLHGVDLVVDAQ